MKKIIISLVFLFLALGSSIHAQYEPYVCEEISTCKTDNSFNYWCAGVGPFFLIPNVGIGHRYYQDHFGYDVSLNLGSVFVVSYLQLNANALYIINPQAQRPFYLGLGGAFGIGTDNKFGRAALTASPNFIFGKELTNNDSYTSFVEAQIQIPTWGWDSHHINSHVRADFPFVYLKYGRSF